jgi:hypothetical protein
MQDEEEDTLTSRPDRADAVCMEDDAVCMEDDAHVYEDTQTPVHLHDVRGTRAPTTSMLEEEHVYEDDSSYQDEDDVQNDRDRSQMQRPATHPPPSPPYQDEDDVQIDRGRSRMHTPYHASSSSSAYAPYPAPFAPQQRLFISPAMSAVCGGEDGGQREREFVGPVMPGEYRRPRRPGSRGSATSNFSVLTGNMFARPMSRRQAIIVFFFNFFFSVLTGNMFVSKV